MAQQGISLAIFSLLLVVTLNLGENSSAEIMETWCVAKPSASDNLLNQNINYACSHVNQFDCAPIKEGSGSPCFNPNTVIQHASYAMNIYYQRSGNHPWDCDFGNSGLISLSDPSHGGCIYPGGPTVIDPSKAGIWCVANPSANPETLQDNIDYACNQVDCTILNLGGVCNEPNDVISHASVAMNLYFQKQGKTRESCNFSGTGLVVITDPSYGNCKYLYRK